MKVELWKTSRWYGVTQTNSQLSGRKENAWSEKTHKHAHATRPFIKTVLRLAVLVQLFRRQKRVKEVYQTTNTLRLRATNPFSVSNPSTLLWRSLEVSVIVMMMILSSFSMTHDLGGSLRSGSGECRETSWLIQHLSSTIQRGKVYSPFAIITNSRASEYYKTYNVVFTLHWLNAIFLGENQSRGSKSENHIYVNGSYLTGPLFARLSGDFNARLPSQMFPYTFLERTCSSTRTRCNNKGLVRVTSQFSTWR